MNPQLFLSLILIGLLGCQSPSKVTAPEREPSAQVQNKYPKINDLACFDSENISPLTGFPVGPQVESLTNSNPTEPLLRKFTTDGCSSSPNGNWVHCCVEHDVHYWMGGTSDERARADEKLKTCMEESGSARTGSLYEGAVRTFGQPNSSQTFRWGYGWNFKRLYGQLSEKELAAIDQIYSQNPDRLKRDLLDQESQPLLTSCLREDLAFQGFRTSDYQLFKFINLHLVKTDFIESLVKTNFNLDAETYELRLASCAQPITLQLENSGKIEATSNQNCDNWKAE